MRATLIDQELEASLERDGYITMPVLSSGEVDELMESFDRLGAAPDDPGVACISTFHSRDAEYKRRVHDVIVAALGPAISTHFDNQRMLPANFIVKWPGDRSGFGLHQDLSVVDEREHRSVEVWVALTDVDESNGNLWMVPGSHSWVPTVRGIHAFDSPFSSVAQRIIERHAVPVPVRRGEAIVFNQAILHFSLPNRSNRPRHVALTQVIPAEAQHIHYFGDGEGAVDVYAIDDSFWYDNSPFTLWRPPPESQRIGPSDFAWQEVTDTDLDRLISEGLAVEAAGPREAINPAHGYCHRCGSAENIDVDPDPWRGNVTLLCPSCQVEEVARAVTPAHVGV